MHCLAGCLSGGVSQPSATVPPPIPSEALPATRADLSALEETPTPHSGPVTITYWEDETDDGAVVLDELAAAFMEEHPDIRIERQHFDTEDLRLQFRAAAINGNPPALVRATGELAGPFSVLEIVRPLDGLFPQSTLDSFFEGALAGARGRGRLWGLPDNYGNHLMLFYNRDLVAEVPTSTDAWISQLKTLTDVSREQYGLVYDQRDPFWLMPWLGGFGGWPLDEDDRPALDTQAMVDALQFLQDLEFVHGVMPGDADYTVAYELFRTGKAAYVIDGSWNLEGYLGSGVNLGVAALPRVSLTGLYPTPMTLGKYWLISKEARGTELDAAVQFVEFMTSSPVQEEWIAKAGRLPSSKDAARSQIVADDPILAGSVDQLSKGRALWAVPEMFCAWRAMRDPLAGVMDGSLGPPDAAAAMQLAAEECVRAMELDEVPAEGQ